MKKIVLFIFPLFTHFITLAQFQIINTPTNKSLEDVYFIDNNIGVAVGDSGTIIRSTDGGLNWVSVLSIDSSSFQKVVFFDALNGIAAGNDIYTTSNAGLTWTLRHKGISFFNHICDVAILNDSSCLVSNNHVALMRTLDRGMNWDTLFSNSSGLSFRAMSFINDSIGFANSQLGPPNMSMLKTLDGGVSWDTIISNSTWNTTVLEDIIFINEQIGFQAGWYNGHFVRTLNGGNTWNWCKVDTTISTQLVDMDINSSRPNSYYACGWYGEILKSNDGGNHWQRIDNKVTNSKLNSIYFLNDTLGWVVGSHGTILRTTNGGGALSINTYKKLEFSAYPNPAHHELNIVLPKDSKHRNTLEIIDLMGKVNYKASFTGSNMRIDITGLSPGIYIVKLIQGDQQGIQKVLIR